MVFSEHGLYVFAKISETHLQVGAYVSIYLRVSEQLGQPPFYMLGVTTDTEWKIDLLEVYHSGFHLMQLASLKHQRNSVCKVSFGNIRSGGYNTSFYKRSTSSYCSNLNSVYIQVFLLWIRVKNIIYNTSECILVRGINIFS